MNRITKIENRLAGPGFKTAYEEKANKDLIKKI